MMAGISDYPAWQFGLVQFRRRQTALLQADILRSQISVKA